MKNLVLELSEVNSMKCPLCENIDCGEFYKDKKRKYFRCNTCALIFVPELYFLSPTDEKRRYDHHVNDINDVNYRRYLFPFFKEVESRVEKNACGLDFGCGPGPALAQMFKESGFQINVYDHFYADDKSVFVKKYDFITATEVIEHLHSPAGVLKKLCNCLNENGILAIMTKLAPKEKVEFAEWFYIRDLTHVCFFSEETFLWISEKLYTKLIVEDNNIIILKKLTNKK